MDNHIITDELVLNQIYLIRGYKVMIDSDLANLYGVENKQLKRQVRRNIERFPDDFMFEITADEYYNARCQSGTLESGTNLKYLPMAFTEQGVSMLSSVLSSPRAVQMNIQIIRIFTRVRNILHDNMEIKLEVEKIKKKLDNQDKNMEIVFKYLDELLNKPELPKPIRKRIGFKPDDL
ncbi:ORF6N domain-containing protein [Pedobacter aquatilis]|uniref:ORF6N domain-containing protein n=1 Tax=Pedobacter aquatilis TaxID=351343 RepID=UPI0025B34963|nr:ORF6N domain-containing protein [Pedobacter aquatilis]MDN3585683.1 ORF6N domain-containing protein [Pedobacter aquatilis]